MHVAACASIMAEATTKFLVNALKLLPAKCIVSQEIGSELKSSLKDNGKVTCDVCVNCNTRLVPGNTCSVRTISERRLKKSSKRYHIVNNNPNKSHYLKIHCKTCKHTLLIPCGLNKKEKATPIVTKTTPIITCNTGKKFVTPKNRRRSSTGLMALVKHTTPITPTSSPSLQDFLIG